jgi:PleD family two-component response regulator
VFTVRLFLPELHNQPGQFAGTNGVRPVRKPRTLCGRRRRILVVDNEEADRELLVSLLEPLGFELRLPPVATMRWTCWPPATTRM